MPTSTTPSPYKTTAPSWEFPLHDRDRHAYISRFWYAIGGDKERGYQDFESTHPQNAATIGRNWQAIAAAEGTDITPLAVVENAPGELEWGEYDF